MAEDTAPRLFSGLVNWSPLPKADSYPEYLSAQIKSAQVLTKQLQGKQDEKPRKKHRGGKKAFFSLNSLNQ